MILELLRPPDYAQQRRRNGPEVSRLLRSPEEIDWCLNDGGGDSTFRKSVDQRAVFRDYHPQIDVEIAGVTCQIQQYPLGTAELARSADGGDAQLLSQHWPRGSGYRNLLTREMNFNGGYLYYLPRRNN